MNKKNIQTAIHQATHFINAATELLRATEADLRATCPKESGATRRASMELTRSLADMRRAN